MNHVGVPSFRELRLVSDVGDFCDYLKGPICFGASFFTIVRPLDYCSF